MMLRPATLTRTDTLFPSTTLFRSCVGMVGWHRLMAARPHVDALAYLAQDDTLVLATERYATLRRLSRNFLDTFTFKASGSGTNLLSALDLLKQEIGRASCRERVCQYV